MESGLGVQSTEFFWGLVLSSKNKTVDWPSDDDEDDEDFDDTLEIRQACLGATANEGERNLVQVTAENDKGEDITHCILSMTVGVNEQTQLFLTLKPPVKFELIAEDSYECPAVWKIGTAAIQSKKRPATSPPSKPPKIAKLAKEEEFESDEESDEEEEKHVTSSSAEPEKAKQKMVKTHREEEEESEDEEESEEGSEVESEEEEEEKVVKKPPFKKPTFKKPQKSNKLMVKTLQPSKPLASKLAVKGSQSLPPAMRKHGKKSH